MIAHPLPDGRGSVRSRAREQAVAVETITSPRLETGAAWFVTGPPVPLRNAGYRRAGRIRYPPPIANLPHRAPHAAKGCRLKVWRTTEHMHRREFVKTAAAAAAAALTSETAQAAAPAKKMIGIQVTVGPLVEKGIEATLDSF